MCGITGCVGGSGAAGVVLAGLETLEYRGYDSAGLAAVRDGGLEVLRVCGRVKELRAATGESLQEAASAVGHTRWATHGPPSVRNAHPHTDTAGRLAVVHNGIVENHRRLRRELEASGIEFRSDTDTEVIAHLVRRHLDAGMDLAAAVRAATRELQGSFALAVLSAEEPDRIVAARRSSPMAVGLGRGRNLVASDALALVPHTREVVYLEDEDLAVLTADGVEILDGEDAPAARPSVTITWDAVAIQKEGYEHFMLKEIHEQPDAVENTVRDRLLDGGVDLGEELPSSLLSEVSRIVVLGMGTSWHAGLIGRNMLERVARIPVQVDYAADFRYREPVVDAGTLVLAVSQSGETADTLEGVRLARRMGVRTAGIVNVVDSSMSREVDGVLYTRAGPEIGVASTKAFTCQLAALYLIAIRLGLERGTLSAEEATRRVENLRAAPGEVRKVLEEAGHIEEIAGKYAGARNCLFLGRGSGFPLALEGALKLKEIAYVHAEGYHAAEMKHGPIALIDENMPVVFLALKGRRYEKIMSNIEEVRSRGGKVIAVASRGDEEISAHADDVIQIPDEIGIANTIPAAVPLQLFAYYAAAQRGCDVDRPRNLAKSVTVE
ncbi:MAG: glutamine--fructose-6-phosphate transaminase (isomerizing) [Planctomycetota bacterium]|jgi:glucosamine--fructose-6-phosphate aminotransferase (isomerizing)